MRSVEIYRRYIISLLRPVEGGVGGEIDFLHFERIGVSVAEELEERERESLPRGGRKGEVLGVFGIVESRGDTLGGKPSWGRNLRIGYVVTKTDDKPIIRPKSRSRKVQGMNKQDPYVCRKELNRTGTFYGISDS